MEILKNFGFDPILLAAQIVNFIIIFYLLKRFLYKPLLDAIKKRQNEIEEGLRSAEESQRLLADTIEKEKEILSKARIESEKIISGAQARSLKASENALTKAKDDAQKIIVEAKESLDRDRREAEAQLEERVTQIAIEILEKSLGKVLGKREQSLITEKAIKELK